MRDLNVLSGPHFVSVVWAMGRRSKSGFLFSALLLVVTVGGRVCRFSAPWESWAGMSRALKVVNVFRGRDENFALRPHVPAYPDVPESPKLCDKGFGWSKKKRTLTNSTPPL